MEKQNHKSRFFAYAPPLKGERQSKRRPVKVPFSGAQPWQCSVYYFWWEYLRRHEGYRATCEASGKGPYSALYADFGDVFATDFWTWWSSHALLFAEPLAREVEIVGNAHEAASDPNTLIIAVPLENKLTLNVKKFKKLIGPRLKRAKRSKIESQARYEVAAKPILSTLHLQLKVWDLHKANPNTPLEDICDLAGVPYNHVIDGETLSALEARDLPTRAFKAALRRRKRLLVQRHLRIAEQYIQNVGKGEFPKRDSR